MGILIAGPLVALWYCWRHHVDLHADNRWLNLAIHGALILLPLLWALLICGQRIQFEETDEISLGYSNAMEKWRKEWWMMFLMWPAPVFGAVVLIQNFFTRYLVHPEALSTSPGKALQFMAVLLGLGIFYWTLVLGRSENEPRLSTEGLRTSLLRFHRWDDLDHVSQHGDLYSVYHRANPGLPMVVIKVRDADKRALLERNLSEHHVRISDAGTPQLTQAKLGVAAGFIVILGCAFWLRWRTNISALGIVLITFGLGIVGTIIFERVRGIYKLAKYKPVIESVPFDDAGDLKS